MPIIPAPYLGAHPKAANWTYFLHQLENFFVIVDARDEAKLPILLNSVSHDALDIFDGLPEPKNTLHNVTTSFSAYFSEKSSVLL